MGSGSASIAINFLVISALGASGGNIHYSVEVLGVTIVVKGNYISSNSQSGFEINGGTSTIVQKKNYF